MATNTGLTVKERLALLNKTNNNDNNNSSSDTPQPVKPPKPAPAVTPKPTSPHSSNENTPVSVGASLKPLTPSKPTSPGNKPTPFNKPATANKPTTFPNKPKPFSSSGEDFTNSNGQESSTSSSSSSSSSPGVQFPKLRSVGGTPRGTAGPPFLAKKPSEFSSQKPSASGDSSHGSGAAMPDKPGPSDRPLSVQERLAAIKQKAAAADLSGGPTPPTPPTPPKPTAKPSAMSSPTTANGPKTAEEAPSAEPVRPLKPSDIARSINQAADRVLRGKATTTGGGMTSPERRKSSQLMHRHSDGKKFRKIDVDSVVTSQAAPEKPSRISDVNLTAFVKLYAAAKEEKLTIDAAKSDLPETAEDGEMEELYVEAESTSVPVRPGRGSLKRAATVRVSQIPEFTEEEEEQELYTDGASVAATTSDLPPPPEELYDDCASAQQEEAQQPQSQPPLEDPDEIYEPLDEDLPPEPQPSPQPSPKTPDHKKDKDKDKDVEKKDKAKEETNKKEEKERKKKEEDIKKLRKKFGLSETDEKVGEGIVKTNAGGGMFSKDLAVTKGEVVTILRMDGNPAGKWLAQNEQGKMGYVNSNNIEVSTPTIRHLMSGVKGDGAAEEEPEEMYEPLPDGDMDEIYEEV